ncbi:hypothetical protein [Janibacter hoylei]|uniref:hypothetical protein n=1 Tax=Janibacter hoylei TaxID=364298 RepID=UPI00248F8BDD|nr:hypothetical protein [Janibacter hoylei]
MSAPVLRWLAASGAVGALALSGCLPGGPNEGSSAGVSGDTTTGPGRPLDLRAVRAAAPAEEEVGDGWRTDHEPISQEPVTARDFTPQSCMQLHRLGPGDDERRYPERGRAEVGYSRAQNGAVSQTLTVSVASYDNPVPSWWLDTAGQALSTCSDYEQRNAYGNPLEYRARAVAFPQLGDQTVAYRITHDLKNETNVVVFTWDVVTVKVGHNLIRVSHQSTKGAPDAETTERTVRATIAGLEEQG